MKITPAQRRALQSVRSERCYRHFSANGNTLKSKDGCGSAVLWKLERMKLIRDGRDIGKVGLTATNLMELTDAGRMALRQAEEQS
jgi:hypothetical protein